MAKFLDETGVGVLWGKTKTKINDELKAQIIDKLGVANGFASLDANGHVPAEAVNISDVDSTKSGLMTPEQLAILNTANNKATTNETNLNSLTTQFNTLKSNFETLLQANPDAAINSFNEIIAFLDNVEDSKTLEGILAGLQTNIADSVADEAKARETADNSIIAMIFASHGQISCGANPGTIEKGVTTNVSINTGVTFNGKALTHTVKVNGADKASSYPVSDTTTFNVVFNIDNADPKIQTTVNRTAKVNAYYPKYYGGSVSTAMTEAGILALVKQSISGGAGGTYNITSSADQYIWFCVPNGMSISKVTLGGFAVPIEAAQTVAVTGKDNYKCYRTTNPLSAGTRQFVIS